MPVGLAHRVMVELPGRPERRGPTIRRTHPILRVVALEMNLAHPVMSITCNPINLTSMHRWLVSFIFSIGLSIRTRGVCASSISASTPEDAKAATMHVQLNGNAYYIKAGLPTLCYHLPCQAGNQLLTIYRWPPPHTFGTVGGALVPHPPDLFCATISHLSLTTSRTLLRS